MKTEFNVSYKYNNGFEEVYIMTSTGKTVVRPALRRYFYRQKLEICGSYNNYLYVKGLSWGVGNRFKPDFATYLFTEEEYMTLLATGLPDEFELVEGYYNT